MRRDTGLDTLLEMDGCIIVLEDKYWYKIEVRLIKEPTPKRPHGISYCLTLHEPGGKRLYGIDNAHAVKSKSRNRYTGQRVEYDHRHRSSSDRGIPYEFIDAHQLIKDFFEEADEVLKKHRGK